MHLACGSIPITGWVSHIQDFSIIDLSSEGHQPMVSASGRYVLTFNGEVYNFSELRDDLEETAITFVVTLILKRCLQRSNSSGELRYRLLVLQVCSHSAFGTELNPHSP